MEIKHIIDPNNSAVISPVGILDESSADELKKYVEDVFKEYDHIIIDMADVEDITDEGLYAIFDILEMIKKTGYFDIINGGVEMASILYQVGYRYFDDKDNGYYSLEDAELPEKILKKIPPYCAEILNRFEAGCYAAVDETGKAKGYIIYTADRYRKEAALYWIYSNDRLAEYFLIQGVEEKLGMLGIDDVRVNYEEASKEENAAYFIEDSIWKALVALEKNND